MRQKKTLASELKIMSRLPKLWKTEGLGKQLIRGTLGSITVKVSYLLLNLAISVMLARALGPEDYGVYSFSMAIIMLLSIPAHFGLPTLVVRLTAVYAGGGEFEKSKGLIRRAAQLSVVMATVVALVGTVVALSLAPPLAPNLLQPLLWSFVLIPVLALCTLYGSALRGLGNVVLGQVPDQFIRPLAFVLIIWASMLIVELTPTIAIVANLIATCLALISGLFLLAMYAPIELTHSKPKFLTSTWIRQAIPFLLLGMSQVVLHQTDIIMLGFLGSATDVGIYRVAIQATDAFGVSLIAITAVISPHLARLYAQNNYDAVRELMVGAHRAGTAMLTPIVIILVWYGGALLGAVFGPEYVAGFTSLRILSLGKLIYASLCFCGAALGMFGLAHIATVTTVMTSFFNAVLNLVWIPKFGMEGAASATALSSLGVNICLAFWLSRHLGANLTAFGKAGARVFKKPRRG